MNSYGILIIATSKGKIYLIRIRQLTGYEIKLEYLNKI